jgi:4'-phosphopantetheinyl transferase
VSKITTVPEISFLLAYNDQDLCLPEATQDSIDLWWVPVPDVSVTSLYSHYHHVLSAGEHQRFLSQRLPKGQLQFLITRIVLRHLFSVYHPDRQPDKWIFEKSETGRPLVDVSQSPLQFNLTHTGKLLLIAMTRSGAPGVDAEVLGRNVNVTEIAQRYFSYAEAMQILDAAPERRNELFLRFWTLKEAAVKATGLGLARELRRFSFTSPMTKNFLFTDNCCTKESQAMKFEFWSTTVDQHVVGVCLASPDNKTADAIRINSRQLVWPTSEENGKISTLNVHWCQSH